MQYAVDVHDAFGRDLTGLILKHQPSHVILHTYTYFEHAIGASIFKDQVKSIQANGCTTGSYVWGFQAADPWQSVADQIDRFREAANHEIPVGFVDCEPYNDGKFSDPGPDVDWLLKAGQQYDAYGVRKGVYSSPSYINERWGQRARELVDAGFLLWLADWGPPSVPALTSPYLPLYGWTTLAAKQWVVDFQGESLDRDVIDDQYTVPADVTAPGDGEPNKNEIIEGLRIALDDVATARLSDDIRALEDVLARLKATQAETRRIRVQFLGEA